MTGVRDLAGHNPTHNLGDRAENITTAAVRFGAVIDPNAADSDLSVPARAVYVGAAGALTLVGVDGTSTTFAGMLAGAIYDIQFVGTRASGSTVTSIVPLY